MNFPIIPKNFETCKEIAENLSIGYMAFYHVPTGKFVFVPNIDMIKSTGCDVFYEEELKDLEDNFQDYIEIPKWSSREAFKAMQEFAEQVTDSKLQNRLFNALSKRKPFAGFRSVLDNNGEHLDFWYEFKAKWETNYVTQQIERMNRKEEEAEEEE